ncbi:MAG: hypothetical protein LBI42_02065 [Chitinispirillales bacterium]|nr:hypothetical protein [Chitinispirillales bacterium]
MRANISLDEAKRRLTVNHPDRFVSFKISLENPYTDLIGKGTNHGSTSVKI